ncbi:hypothetical protein ACSSS7_002505 [Eimeria intestinalis]
MAILVCYHCAYCCGCRVDRFSFLFIINRVYLALTCVFLQFSEEDFDEDGAAHLRLENDIPTFASVQVAFPGRSAESKAANGAGVASSSSKAVPASGKASRALADPAAANEQQQTGIEMGGSHVVRANPPPHEEALPSNETQIIGRSNFAQPMEADHAPAPADTEKAEP